VFLEEANNELLSRSDSLFNHSATMSSLALARPSLFCDILSAEAQNVTDGLVRKFKTDYLLLFNSVFDSDKEAKLFNCPAKSSLTTEMSYCRKNPTISTPFCDSFALYVMDLRWVSDTLELTQERLARLVADTSTLKSELESLEAQLNAEIEVSYSKYGNLLD
jgi:hypothetical protein